MQWRQAGQSLAVTLAKSPGHLQPAARDCPAAAETIQARGFPYMVANSLFLGDDTSLANASIRLARVELNSVPEPAGLLLAAFGFAGLIAWLASHSEVRPCWSR